MKINATKYWLTLAAGTAMVMMMQTTSPAATLVSRYSFNETSGTNATDSVGGYTAALRGGTSFDGAGKVVLNGTNSYVNLPSAQLSSVTAMTPNARNTTTSNAAGPVVVRKAIAAINPAVTVRSMRRSGARGRAGRLHRNNRPVSSPFHGRRGEHLSSGMLRER